uniref:Pre-mRNA-splicing factor SPF27 n=1 Tax=Ornithorhynchus anatinus TaxID=9258 RepID=A0A6I8PH76_ORNAN
LTNAQLEDVGVVGPAHHEADDQHGQPGQGPAAAAAAPAPAPRRGHLPPSLPPQLRSALDSAGPAPPGWPGSERGRMPLGVDNSATDREHPGPMTGSRSNISIGITAFHCVNNSTAQLEQQAVRIENLELRSQHGCSAWKVFNENLVHMIEQAQKELQKRRKHIQDLNWQHKNMQLTAEMQSTWVSLVSKNYEIERTVVQLEKEIHQIKQQHGEANKENIQQDF